MNVVIDRDILVRALSAAQGICKTGSNNPALACAYLRTSHLDGATRLVMSATDTLIYLTTDHAVTTLSDGEVVVRCADLLGVAKALPPGQVHLVLGKANRLRVNDAAGGSTAHLNTLQPEDFPPPIASEEVRVPKSFQVTGRALARMIDGAGYAISDNENRYGLNGAHLEAGQTNGAAVVRMVATDGSRLARIEVPYTGQLSMPNKRLLPGRALQELRRVVATDDTIWTVTPAGNAITFSAPGVRLMCRYVDGEFPDYQQVIPDRYSRTFRVERKVIDGAMRRIGLFATGKNHDTQFEFKDNLLVLTATDLDMGDGREEVHGELVGEPMTTGFNLQYIREVIDRNAGDVEFQMSDDALGPCRVVMLSSPDMLSIVMPMRLN